MTKSKPAKSREDQNAFAEPTVRQRHKSRKGPRLPEDKGLDELKKLRRSLMDEQKDLESEPDYLHGSEADACCQRSFNQMRITPLEARAIQIVFRKDPAIRERLPQILAKLREELRFLKDNDERQNFDCPLLENGKCLIHKSAKPIGCLAWHPAPKDNVDPEAHFTEFGWNSFEYRDELNDAVYGDEWKLRVIPLWLRRILAEELATLGTGPVPEQIHVPSRRVKKSPHRRRPDR